MKRAMSIALQVTLLAGLTTAMIGTLPAHAAALEACSGSTSFPANDDDSVGPVSLGFNANFFGTTYSNVFVNNNGNLTFSSALGTFTPSAIGTGLGFPIIAPFWADVDTRGAASGIVSYGTTNYGGHNAFCATWPLVGYFSGQTDKVNTFQVLLVDRSDVGVGDFDIIFNYNQIQWETGGASGGTDGLGGDSARAGYSDGQSGGTSFEFPGSGINGGLLDSNTTTGLINQSNDGTPGQDVFQVRAGAPTGAAPTITSDNNTTFTAGSAGSFTVTTLGTPTPSISESGALPSGVTFTDNGDGTATLAGTPDPGTGGTYPVTIGATNGVSPDASQSFTLNVDEAPAFTSADNATFTEGVPGTFTVTTTGNPTPTLQNNGDVSLPGGMSFQDNGDGTATLSGTPSAGTASNSPYQEDWLAQNIVANNDQPFTITINPPAGGPNLTLSKSGSPDPVQELNPITYKLVAGNNGSADANGVVVTDNLPAGTVFDSASTTQGTCSHTATTVTCTVGTLAAAGSATVTIIVQAPNVTANTTITNNASVSASNAGAATATFDSHVLVNTGGSTSGTVPPNTKVPLTFTTSTLSTSSGTPAVDGSDPTAVSLTVPPGGPGGNLSLQELPCTVAPCDGSTAATNTATTTSSTIVLGGVVFSVVPPPNYPNNLPFRATLLYDTTLHATQGPVFYFKPGVTPQEIKLPHCGHGVPAGKPCVLTNEKITSGPALIRGDWKVVVRLNSDPHLRR
jgi:uncharacterized repeat protein (TIGR01451 family)